MAIKFLKKKEKKSTEPIIKANGKVVITDFSRLNPNDFKYADLSEESIKEQLALLSSDGKIFINQEKKGHEAVADIFEILMRESRYNLDQYAKTYRKQFSNITFSNWSEMQGKDEERIYVLAALLCPIEVARRQIEKAYYSKK